MIEGNIRYIYIKLENDFLITYFEMFHFHYCVLNFLLSLKNHLIVSRIEQQQLKENVIIYGYVFNGSYNIRFFSYNNLSYTLSESIVLFPNVNGNIQFISLSDYNLFHLRMVNCLSDNISKYYGQVTSF